MNRINAAEMAQLGATKDNGFPYFKSLSDWSKFRKFLIQKSQSRNPDHFDPALAAYTPGETLQLLAHPQITQWFQYLETFQIPNDAQAVVLVPCAASKPWRAHRNVNKSTLYKAYNQILDDINAGDFPNVYFLTISEPLGIVPQERWGDFPKYDNPGLFKDDFLRTGLVKTDWSSTFLGTRYALPFDQQAYEQCIEQLAQVIARTLCKISVPILSFVDAKESTTHGHMLDAAQTLNPSLSILRHAKKAKARSSPYDYMKATILNHLATQIEPQKPSKKIKI